ncbi:MAG: type II toxin-antitoxin system HicB family antitoxin [Magnetococcales bacterium]|nr:type II toxin-antitoxin system HicB family antitoxin [Magnetococcales bacterium]
MIEIDYPFTIRPLNADEGGGYLIEFPDLPGCMSDGETLEEAIANGKEAMLSWIEVAREQGRNIPEPHSAGKFSGQWRMRVPKSLHADLARRAQLEGVRLNTLAVTLIAEGLGRLHMAG